MKHEGKIANNVKEYTEVQNERDYKDIVLQRVLAFRYFIGISPGDSDFSSAHRTTQNTFKWRERIWREKSHMVKGTQVISSR